MRKRKGAGAPPSLVSLRDIAEALSVPAPRAAAANETIALMLDSALAPDSSVLPFYRQQGTSWELGDMPSQCPASADIPDHLQLPAGFTAPTVTMQSDNPKIKSLADSLVQAAHTRCDSIDCCFRYVYRTLVKKLSPTFSNALETLEAGYGDCGEHAVLLGALLRAVGIPARAVLGLVYLPGKGYYYHAWVLAGTSGTWLFVDPTLGVFPAFRDRVPLLIDDSGSESVKLAKFIGRIEIEYVKKAK
jgi:transglutaminase-like putative cysteine protease